MRAGPTGHVAAGSEGGGVARVSGSRRESCQLMDKDISNAASALPNEIRNRGRKRVGQTGRTFKNNFNFALTEARRELFGMRDGGMMSSAFMAPRFSLTNTKVVSL